MSIGNEPLNHAWRRLLEEWASARESWQDPVQRHFQSEYWQEYERVVPAGLQEMYRLEKTIAQIRREIP